MLRSSLWDPEMMGAQEHTNPNTAAPRLAGMICEACLAPCWRQCGTASLN